MARDTARDGTKTIASNRRARRDYSIIDVVEAGLVLRGAEVKSLRDGHVQMGDGFARFHDGEAWLEGVHIAPYSNAAGFGAQDPDRRRKLLLHADEIDRWADRVARERLTVVPLRLYFRDGRAKVELGLARAHRKADKRQALAEREAEREAARAMGRQRKGVTARQWPG
jgi:SsrA-binding protein